MPNVDPAQSFYLIVTVCGPAGADRDALAAEYRLMHKLAGVPPGSIVRPRS
jgi:hypothetical protein